MITPADSPSSPSGYAGVTPHGQGTAPYDVQAPQADLSAAAAAAQSAAMSRQGPTEALIQSPPGAADFDILEGTTAGWPADVTP